MPDDTDILGLPLILPSQAQKHVTHNEALAALDVLVQLAVIDRSQTVPPALAVPGDRHIVPAGATLDWAGRAGQVAVMTAAGWQFHQPRPGWQAQVLAEGQVAVFDGLAWKTPSEGSLTVARLGISSTPDAVNRLAVSAPATLLNHAGAGHQLKLNKAAAGDTASLLFQTGFSGRAEMGTTGSDEFQIRTSADGTSFQTGIRVSPTGVKLELPVTGNAVTQSKADVTAGRLLKVGDFGLGGGLSVSPEIVFADINAANVPAGFYPTTSNTAGTFPPGESQFGQLIVLRYNDANFSQVWMSALGDTLYTRRYRSVDVPAFSPWRPLFSRHNLLGTVSQSGGVPTGRVIERGANANGEYVRFADGTQICTRTNLSAANANTAVGSLFRSADLTWIYPAGFVAAPVVAGDADDADCWMATAGAPGAGAAALRVIAAVTKPAALTLRAVATGRWF